MGPAQAAPPTGDSGGYGGNMDFNEIGEGAILYLPVANPGALLYLGDAHAEQGTDSAIMRPLRFSISQTSV